MIPHSTPRSSIDSRQDVTTATLASIAGWLLFGVGVVAPLTPSEGRPGVLALLIFVGAPTLLFAWLGIKGTSRFVRFAGWAQLCVLAWFVWVVLAAVFRP
jgi:hypothetical protein